MFKWIKKKVLKSIIKDVIKGLPSIKCKVETALKDNADVLVSEVKNAIKKRLKEIFN